LPFFQAFHPFVGLSLAHIGIPILIRISSRNLASQTVPSPVGGRDQWKNLVKRVT
jgi:hypothetical protein